MIYDFVLSTGHFSVSGCSSEKLGTDTFKLFNNEAVGSFSRFYYDRSISTGQKELDLSLNGQSLLQEIPFLQETLNEFVYQIYTGDFFTKGSEANTFDVNELNFDSSVPVNAESEVIYDVITGGIFAGTSDSGENLKTGINHQYLQNGIFTDYDYFINGQKTYSGHGVGFAMMVGGTEPYDFYPNFGIGSDQGIITENNKDNFRLTAHRKRTRTAQFTGRYYEPVFGVDFLEKRTNFYVNGILQPKNNYLELYTGVNLIKTGFDATVSGGFYEALSGSSMQL